MNDLVVGVVGATGYAGAELCRLLLEHPHVGEIRAASRSGADIEQTNAALDGSGVRSLRVDELLDHLDELDVAFLCTPTGEAMRLAPALLDAGVRVVDLSADFRFATARSFEEAHGKPHTAPGLLPRAVYGFTEVFRDRIRDAALIANPGCYALTALLALTPLHAAGLVDTSQRVAVFAVNGTSGAGIEARRPLSVTEMAGALLPYNLDGHRHAPEIHEVITRIVGSSPDIDLTTAHGDFPRGIHLQASAVLRDGAGRDDVLECLAAFYRERDAAFVHVNRRTHDAVKNAKQYDVYPNLRHVVGTNRCFLGADVDGAAGVVRLVGVTDNLVKGAAGSAIQNMNVSLRLPERAGLAMRGF
ncbi:N-acetyl-gamma-glutamyl-phosphate reductase [Clavibacter sp. VKM Ac-2873]|uniref:N-acetyl-gamma-glutamyl-phosphate reductase n=1 Tax=Clavibacter sp. VKM Ac-2873 TaxID=2783813 RepID=UPI00188A8286|nr:N-acetyl-gamma-glutamyl-phosphate reductase [Clavibacter sp. VKM Ac-2873]MBF4619277.1 N-acetyl-gamma-glutamyl-phosphate reductase [Clavibacter sp. VKM Ac-2873]